MHEALLWSLGIFLLAFAVASLVAKFPGAGYRHSRRKRHGAKRALAKMKARQTQESESSLSPELLDTERGLFFNYQHQAIARLFAGNDGGTFTTDEYDRSMRVVLKQPADRPGPSLDKLRRQLAENPNVIQVGPDLWMTNDSREH